MADESVWVIAVDYGYDGLTEPSHAFKTKDEAEIFLRALRRLAAAPTVRLMEVPFWDAKDIEAPHG
jgi:hypothetical protein